MKKLVAVFMSFGICLTSVGAMAALQVTKSSSKSGGSSALAGGGTVSANGIKKASSVKQQEKSGLESITAGSLVPGVIGLVTNVTALAKQQQELAQECVPSSQEIEFVKDLVKEEAKIGTQASSMIDEGDICNDVTYASSVAENVPLKLQPCFADTFKEKESNGYIWAGFPIPATAKYCADGTTECSTSKKKTTSNIYDIFSKITLSPEDLTEAEATKYEKFMAKTEKCSPAGLKSRKKEAYVGFVKNAISGVGGQKANTASVWDAVGGLTQSVGGGGGLSGGIQSLMPAVSGFLDK